jgi:general nucleoside transport system ATP-binding protein
VSGPRQARPTQETTIPDDRTPATSTAPPRPDVAVELTGVTKRFPGVVANRDVDLRVRTGTVHALVGENGAGKSTLMKILYGMQRPDEGTIRVDGREVRLHDPGDAIDAGIGMVHQHFMLADNLTVLENVVLGSEPRRGGVVLDLRTARRRIAEISDAYGLGVRPDRLVADLGVGERQRVEILKVLYRGARILILDEPTAVLVPHEVDELFDNLRELKAEGLTVLFISHKLDEVLSVADDVTVIRRGTTVATVDPRTTTARQLAELMVGSELPSPETRESTVTDDEVLRVEGLTLRDADGRAVVDDVSFVIRRGEVLGLAGVEGNGQAELVEALIGTRRAETGRTVLRGDDISAWTTRARREGGIGYVPEDRHRHGLLLDAPLWENRVLGHQTEPSLSRGPWLDRGAARADATRIVEQYDVRTPGIDTLASALSGGNQQKFIVGRELSGDLSLLIASHPTRGVDVGAQAAIWDAVRAARREGLAVLLVSADLDELIGLSDRICVVLRGRVVAEVDPSDVTPEQLGSAMTGASRDSAGGTA